MYYFFEIRNCNRRKWMTDYIFNTKGYFFACLRAHEKCRNCNDFLNSINYSIKLLNLLFSVSVSRKKYKCVILLKIL